MAPRGRKKKTGLLREDAARDAMRQYGFEENVINETIKELVELYTEKGWHLIEDCSYRALLDAILAKNEIQGPEEEEPHDEPLEEPQAEPQVEPQEDPQEEPEEDPEEEEPQEDPQEDLEEDPQEDLEEEPREEDPEEEDPEEEDPEEDPKEEAEDQYVDGGRDQVGSNSVSLVGNGQEMGTQTCQTDAISINNEVVMDSQAFHSAEAFAPHYLGGIGSRCGWLSSEDDESDPEEDDDDDDGDDDEMIQLTPTPLCEELKELVQEVKRQQKRKI